MSTDAGNTIERVTAWTRAPDRWAKTVPWPTLFTHPQFTAYKRYPAGVADMVGYWAEDRILGGVTLFDRSRTWAENEPNAYFHSARAGGTFRIYQLLDEQQISLLCYLTTPTGKDAPRDPCPLPLRPTPQNTIRIHPNEALSTHRIYRDIWERELPRYRLRMQKYMQRDVLDSVDHPEIDAEMKRINVIRKGHHPAGDNSNSAID